MNSSKMKLVLVSTPIGSIGSGRGGGVELTLSSLAQALLTMGHQVTLVAPEGSILPDGCTGIDLKLVGGVDQPSWQHLSSDAPVVIPFNGVLPKLWDLALELGESADAVINFGYDWLPIWLTTRVKSRVFHLISMGAVSQLMRSLIEDLARTNQSRLAFHSYRQASDFDLLEDPIVVGNGFDLRKYELGLKKGGPLGWAGRIAPEKGLEDAVAVAAALGDRLLVWGIMEDQRYASDIEASVPAGTIDWRGFLPTVEFQRELKSCRAFLNTPKWNEAYGNVVIEAMACGVPVISYDRGGPGELIESGFTGWLVTPGDVKALTKATTCVSEIDRRNCRRWVEKSASQEVFASRVLNWLQAGIAADAAEFSYEDKNV